jgi:hypothetical protein
VRPVLVLPLPITDFIAFSPDHSYIHRATGEAWTSMAVNARVMPIEIGSDKKPLAACLARPQRRGGAARLGSRRTAGHREQAGG